MSTTLEPLKPASPAGKPVWAAVGVFAVAVLAMGAALVHIQTQPEEPQAAVLSIMAPAATPSAASTAEKPAERK